MASITQTPPKGELVLLIAPPDSDALWSEEQVRAALDEQIAEVGVKRASSAVAELSKWPKREVYALALSLK